MNSDAILALIDDIASTSKKTAKVALVAANKNDSGFIRVLQAALDPIVTYNMQQVPERPAGATGTAVFDQTVWNLLEQLADRRLTGNLATGVVEDSLGWFSPQSAELLKRIIKKDLRAGFGASTVNKAIPDLIPEFPYMRCSLPAKVKLHEWPWAAGNISQEKADAMFANFSRRDDGVSIMSRQGQQFPLGPLADVVGAMLAQLKPETQSHGELMVQKNGVLLPREVSNGVMNRITKGGDLEPGERVVASLWDQIPLTAVKPKGTFTTPYATRLEDLRQQLTVAGSPLSLIDSRIVHSVEEAYAHYREMLAKGKEGTIVKRHDAVWRDGDSKEQVKLKLAVDVDLTIVGFRPGEGKNAATFGSVVCRTADDLLEVAVSGMSDKVRNEVAANKDSYLGTVVTVRANCIMVPPKAGDLHSLFSPRCIEFRTDKSVADTFKRVRDQFESAIGIAA
jgi:DNA ligase-1